MTEQWRRISENLKKSLDSGVFKVWIAPLIGNADGHILRLTSQSAYAANWLRDRLGEALRQAAAPVLGVDPACVELDIQIQAQPCAARTATPHAAPPVSALAAPVTSAASVAPVVSVAPIPNAASAPAHASFASRSEAPAQGHLPLPLLPIPRWRHTFADFVVGPANAVAVAAAQDLCQPRPAVETLFVSAASGLGKTHLIHAVGQCLCQERGEAQVGYLTAEDFTSRFVMASRTRQMDSFKASLRELDVLLLDDVHFFQGKEKTQDEALSTIKSLQARGSRVVLTSSFSPRELHDVDSQLVSYFCSGLLATMQKPTVDMRRDMLTRKARVHQVLLPEPVADLLARRLDNDVRQLESCLNNLIFKARHLNRQICLDLALDVLGQYASAERTLDVESIIRLVCESYGLAPHQLTSRSRRHEYVLARNTIYYLSRKHTALSLQEIGDRFNRRHSTVIKGITALERELQRGSTLGRQVANAVQLIERNAGV